LIHIVSNEEEFSEISIMNAIGEEVYFSKLNGNFQAYNLDVNFLSSGIYFMKVGDKIQKIIKR
jgi:hypothetical protein